jgi:glycine/D-amino acid oxidase-like deaminating enzyme
VSTVTQTNPYWEQDLAPLIPPLISPLAPELDTVIIGGGYTGLSAAIELASAQQPVCVLEQSDLFAKAGVGCSSRNGGQVGFSLKPSLARLTHFYGAQTAERIYLEAIAACTELATWVDPAAIDWQQHGTLVGAHSPKAFNSLVRQAEWFANRYAQSMTVVARARLAQEIDSPLYHGAVVYPQEASIQPRKLHQWLLRKAMRLGVPLYEHTTVVNLTRARTGFLLQVVTPSQPQQPICLKAKRVLVATNGTTTKALGALSRWVFPVGSYQLVTEPLAEDLVKRLIPQHRNVSDTRRVVTYTRRSPDGRRIIFGGRSARLETTPAQALKPLQQQLLQVFPSLGQARIDHVWLGHVGFTFREHALVGVDRDCYHALGYCGQGIPLACYYGRRIGRVMAGTGEPPALWNLGQVTRPYYRRRAWFLPLAIQAYRWADQWGW